MWTRITPTICFVASITVLSQIGAHAAEAQAAAGASTSVTVRRADMPQANVDVTLNGVTKTAQLNERGEATLVFAGVQPANVRLSAAVRKIGYSTTKASKDVDLNGSGRLDFMLADGTTALRQFPYVVWTASAGSLDVSIDGATKGSTRLALGVSPDKKHVVAWKREAVVVCTLEVTLPWDVSREYRCDTATGVAAVP